MFFRAKKAYLGQKVLFLLLCGYQKAIISFQNWNIYTKAAWKHFYGHSTPPGTDLASNTLKTVQFKAIFRAENTLIWAYLNHKVLFSCFVGTKKQQKFSKSKDLLKSYLEIFLWPANSTWNRFKTKDIEKWPIFWPVPPPGANLAGWNVITISKILPKYYNLAAVRLKN